MKRKWEVLSHRLVATGKYHGSRLKPRLLASRYHAGRAVIRETSEETGDRTILAYAALWPTYRGWYNDWYELGTVWISEGFRGNGLCQVMMGSVLELAPPSTKFFLFTDNKVVMEAARHLGFAQIDENAEGLLRWASKVHVVCRLPGSLFREEKRRLFVRGTW